ncbi:MAG: hypothetical protein KDE50_16735 [Caldilineaceae bacterium]|nr:hypothetical protein [Caldilineaceae bacterium]MCB0141555.1 hypothetical protein [Caldilineaceae bacterium]
MNLNAFLAFVILLLLANRPVVGQQPPPISTPYAVTATPSPTLAAPTPAPAERQVWLPIIKNQE